MAEIKWEKDLQAGLALSANSHKPIYLDFWFEG
jgi:hypothetical protein